ncbi:4-hydroxybenzoate octaprenyltransferase [Chitinimonas arctica]|uniref:4-hydroxybenzoate octaprenyltransferase n=1 Tax=Chitinimonas arctica TaxID=2594795 RepID=A0A516S9Q7_9NEIS|nr:4-hydroxybenzoate octaprenyltransferase [Chitinimonas arctica]QDQ24883.1 4-hydroxybenzoate octaprenyltransferase [Chitinimonas arctica]
MNGNTLPSRLSLYAKLMRLDKPIGILLLLWPTLWGLCIASQGRPDPAILIIFLLGTVLMRSAGCVINDYADRDFDPQVERTKLRPMATGSVSTREALLLAGTLAACALLLILPLNGLTLWMSVPAVLLAGSYPYTKRFLPIPQAYLGLAFSFGIPMAFAAVNGKVDAVAWYLVAANLFWVVAYDTEYAMVDKVDDLKIGIKTSAITFGRFDAEAVMICHLAFLLGMAALGWHLQRHAWWYLGLAVAAVLIALQYRQIRGRDRLKCMQAFLDNNRVGAVLFIGILLDYRVSWPI